MSGKNELRREMNANILSMSEGDRIERSSNIQKKFVALPEFASAKCVAGYIAMPFEVATDAILRSALEAGKTVCLPRTDWDAHRMEMIVIGDLDNELAEGGKGILEPTGDSLVELSEIDIVIVPGRAFDILCNRVGQGGGFYDAFRGSLRSGCIKCAVAYDMQMLDVVPTERHDLSVDIVVTESAIHRR